MKKVDTLSAIAQDARAQCTPDEKFNLVLEYELPFSATDDAFVRGYQERALLWMQDTAPSTQYFSHGQYFRGSTGIRYLLDELKNKKKSRRALLSLICMDDLLGQHPGRPATEPDAPLPAFLVLQFAIENSTLYATAYFRALEVVEFLPINLAEMALHCRKINEGVDQELDTIHLTVVAFRAYAKPGFRCLQKATIDSANPMDILLAVSSLDFVKLMNWLGEKLQPDSAILLNGITAMRDALQRVDKPQYTIIFRNAIDDALAALSEYGDLRHGASEGRLLDEKWNIFTSSLERALRELDTQRGA